VDFEGIAYLVQWLGYGLADWRIFVRSLAGERDFFFFGAFSSRPYPISYLKDKKCSLTWVKKSGGEAD
jgi:hypothetical protein